MRFKINERLPCDKSDTECTTFMIKYLVKAIPVLSPFIYRNILPLCEIPAFYDGSDPKFFTVKPKLQ